MGVLDQPRLEELGIQLLRVGTGLLDDVLDGDAQRVQLLEAGPQLVEVPVFGIPLGGGPADVGADHVVDHVLHLLVQVFAVEHPLALGVDHLTLLVEHLVVLEDVLADLRVLRLDLGLRALDLAADHLRLDRYVLGDVEAVHDRLDGTGPEAPHQLVLQRQVEARLARVTLPAGPAAQLVVDTPRLVPLGAQDVQATGVDDLLALLLAQLLPLAQRVVPRRVVLVGLRFQPALAQLRGGEELRVAAEQDVGTAAGHVGRDGDAALAPGLRDDLRLLGVELRVEHRVRDAPAAQHLRQDLGVLHGDGTHQHRLALPVPLGDVLDDRVELRLLGLVDDVGPVGADHRPVGRDRHDADVVHLVELGRLGLRGTGHPGQLLVEPEVVLQGDRREGLVLLLDLHALFGLDGLVHALVVPAAVQDPAGELVDDQHLAVGDDVVLVALVELLGLDGVVQVPDERGVHRLVQVLDAQPVLDLGHTTLADRDGALGLVDLVVALALLAALHLVDDPGELGVPAGRLLGRTGDDQRGARLVDQDRVHLVDDRVVQAALEALLDVHRHVVAQVIEAEFVVGAVGDVGGIGLALVLRLHVRQVDADRKPEEVEDLAHPLGIAPREVIVHRDDVNAFAGERIEVCRQGGDERLALAGFHLGDLAVVQHHATEELHVEMTHAQAAFRCLAHHRERLGQQLLDGRAAGVALLQLIGLAGKRAIGERRHPGLESVDLRDRARVLLQQPLVAAAEQARRHAPKSF